MRRIRKPKVPDRRCIFQKQAPIGVNLNQLASRKGTPYLDASEKNYLLTKKNEHSPGQHMNETGANVPAAGLPEPVR